MKATTHLTLALATLLSLAGTTSATPTRQAQDLFRTTSTFTLDFNTLPVGARVASLTLEQGITGTGISSAFLGLSGENVVHVSGQRRDREGDSNHAMTFDGECGGDASGCSGNDDDLFEPGQGNLLIVSQDGDGSSPNDNHEGGHVDIDFSDFGSGRVSVTSVSVFDVSHSGATVALYADGEKLEEVPIPRGGTGEKATVDLNTSGVDFVRISVKDSFAVDDLSFTLE